MGNKRKIQIKTIKWIKNAEIICGIKKIIKKTFIFYIKCYSFTFLWVSTYGKFYFLNEYEVLFYYICYFKT